MGHWATDMEVMAVMLVTVNMEMVVSRATEPEYGDGGNADGGQAASRAMRLDACDCGTTFTLANH